MSTALWSSIPAAVSIGGLWLAGANPRTGWITGIAAQTVWATYGATTAQPGMVALAVVYTALYSRNLWQTRGAAFPSPPRPWPHWRHRAGCGRQAAAPDAGGADLPESTRDSLSGGHR